MPDRSDILNSCLQAVESGESTIEECEAKYPDFKGLGSLLRLAMAVQEQSRLRMPEARRNALERRLTQLAKTRASAQRSPRRWLVPLVSVAAVFIVLFVLGFSAARLADFAVPGDTLYGVKRAVEGAELAFAGGYSRPDVLHEIALSRLEELETMAVRGQTLDPAFLQETTTAVNDALAAQIDPGKRAQLYNQAIQVLRLAETLPNADKDSIASAISTINTPELTPVAGSPSPTPTLTATATLTSTVIPTEQPSATLTTTPTIQPTNTVTLESTATPTATTPSAPTNTDVPPSPTLTPTVPTPLPTFTPTDQPTVTVIAPTSTIDGSPLQPFPTESGDTNLTAVPSNSPTATESPVETSSAPTATWTPSATITMGPCPSATPTFTPSPDGGPTETPSDTSISAIPTIDRTLWPCETWTPTPEPTHAPTNTPTDAPTNTPTETPTVTPVPPTRTPTVEATTAS